MFKVGDKVKVVDENQSGVVVKVHNHKITLLNEYGFEEIFNASELLIHQELPVKDFEPVAEAAQQKSKPHQTDEPKEIDLHIGHLVDYTSHMTNFEMLQIQLNKVKSEIDLARSEKRSRLIFIHGHGSGKLREELHRLLENYLRLEFYDASFRKYKLGATEVRLF